MQLQHCYDGYKLKQRRAVAQQDELNHLFGRYIALAFNNPQKYPEKPVWADQLNRLDTTTKQMSDDEMCLRGKLFAKKYGKVIENGKNDGKRITSSN